MHPLSKGARFILDQMEPDRRYETLDLRALVPQFSAEDLREAMHELWVSRHVERVGESGWQCHLSAPPHRDVGHVSGLRQTKVVKPEDLFDHDSFTDFFR
jgi:hypothetical protein